jgi:polysaccharide export outer membrane protein
MMHILFSCFSRSKLIWAAVFFFTVLLSSCRISKENVYFKTLQKDTTINKLVSKDFESKIQVADQLSIVATSLSTDEDNQFNKAAATSSSPAQSGFKVYEDGTVLLHRLGKVKAAGLTRKDLADQLQVDLLPYMKDPIVNVNYLNHKVTVIGQVGTPQVLQMPEEQLSLIDVLVKSGDIGKNGLLNKVMLIRDSSNKKIVKFVDLEDHSIFSSPWFYVQPNDIVVVRADLEKIRSDERTRNVQTNIGLFASILSLVIVVYTLITR